MIKIKINKINIKIKKSNTIMNIANKYGIYIPYFCYHKKLSISANCRMCLVEIEKSIKPLPACATFVTNGMIIKTNTKKIIEIRKNIMEFLLINHPLDCPICDKGGECTLQDLSVKYGNYNSRYYEKKRIVRKKNISPFISTEEMNRCIHCTRCVRFDNEITEEMKLGIINKGEKSEIVTFFNNKINSELSGNMIDLCPVGALTSKSFRYKARPWELISKKSISPHDSLGTNLIIQSKNNKIIRILPYENENINECWISNKDRFSYDALSNKNRLTNSKININGIWNNIKLSIAIEYIKKKIFKIINLYGTNSIVIICNPMSTLEELFLLKKIIKGIGSNNIDFRLRQVDFNLSNKIIPWLGILIKDISNIDNALIIGSFLEEENPIILLKIKQSIKNGSKINIINADDNNKCLNISNKIIIKPSLWIKILSEILKHILLKKKEILPNFLKNVKISDKSKNIANDLLHFKNKIILLGNLVVQHFNYSQIHIISQIISEKTNTKLGYLTESCNTIGAYITKVFSKNKNINIQSFFKNKYKAYILFNVEPELDCYNSKNFKHILKSKFVVTISPYMYNTEYSKILLPITPFTETSGTFINTEGTIQSFKKSIKPLGNSIPGWKLLCILGKKLNLFNFNYKSSKIIKKEILIKKNLIFNKLNNFCKINVNIKINKKYLNLEKIIYIPIFFSNSISRRSKILLNAKNFKEPKVLISKKLSKKLSIINNDLVYIKQDKEKIVLYAYINNNLPDDVIQITGAHRKTSILLGKFGSIFIKKYNI